MPGKLLPGARREKVFLAWTISLKSALILSYSCGREVCGKDNMAATCDQQRLTPGILS